MVLLCSSSFVSVVSERNRLRVWGLFIGLWGLVRVSVPDAFNETIVGSLDTFVLAVYLTFFCVQLVSRL